MKIAVNLWTIYGWKPEDTLSEDVLNKLKIFGAEGIELIMDEHHFAMDKLLESLPRFSSYLQRYGLDASGVATGLFWQYNPGSQQPEVREKVLQIIRNECKIAQAYGAPIVLVIPGMQESRVDYNQTYETAVKTIRQGAEYAAEYNVTIGLENVATNFLQSPREFIKFLRDVDSPNVRAYFDMGNVLAAHQDYPENWICTLGERILCVHAKDYDKANTSPSGFRLCGKGSLDWMEIFTALRRVSYDGFVVIETPPGNGVGVALETGLQAAKLGIDWLREYVMIEGVNTLHREEHIE